MITGWTNQVLGRKRTKSTWGNGYLVTLIVKKLAKVAQIRRCYSTYYILKGRAFHLGNYLTGFLELHIHCIF